MVSMTAVAYLFKARPKKNIEADSKTISFNKNWPGKTDNAGNPPKEASQPGAVNKKVVVRAKVIMAIALPKISKNFNHMPSNRKRPVAISITPIKLDVVWLSIKLYSQLVKGELLTKPWIASAS